MSIRPLLAIVLVTLAVGACGADEPSPDDLVHSIHEPWQLEPFGAEPAAIAGAQAACRDVNQGAPLQQPRNVSLAAVDARGASKLLLVWAGPTAEAECLVELARSGQALVKSGGTSDGVVFRVLAPGAIEAQGGGTSEDGANSMSSVVGRVGPGVARVGVELADGQSIVASLGPTGWFAAWWPSAVAYRQLSAYDGAGGVQSIGP